MDRARQLLPKAAEEAPADGRRPAAAAISEAAGEEEGGGEKVSLQRAAALRWRRSARRTPAPPILWRRSVPPPAQSLRGPLQGRTVVVAGLCQRFCQQCSRFHEISEFDDAKRSCRKRLAGHNERRRKICHDIEGEGGSNLCRPADQHRRMKISFSANSTCNRFQVR
ncbi:unnamed protein product [Spirodela intermedia]|uniref:SBP-type domain-containing protein n=1 Tax=Spirodela intermedia TaxID=51605 RepID=A0A7I8JEV2_SPIIN|nr:unnamed protein product [Spirodela intermedia]CAA6668680.1 unnamed protein product [Spirodela intermedia]